MQYAQWGGVQPLISDISVSAYSSSDELSYGDYLKYKKVDEDYDGTYDYICITDCDESATEVEIPSEIDGLKVAAIGKQAFYNCTNLANVNIPDGVTIIEGSAFSFCTNLINIKIPDGVTSIGDYAFCECTSLTNIKIPDSVTSIGDYAFCKCTSLASINISDNVTSIGEAAFYYCENLTNISIPDSVTSIGRNAFDKTALLESQTGVKYVDKWIVDYDKDVTTVEIKDGTRGIGDNAFMNCRSFTSINIPDSVTSIGNYAFDYCINLESIIIRNPDCKIYDYKETISNKYDSEINVSYFDGTIYGYENSTAQAYAEKYGRKFEIIGDLNGDGTVSSADAVLMNEFLTNSGTSQDILTAVADMNGDGVINVFDLIILKRSLLS